MIENMQAEKGRVQVKIQCIVQVTQVYEAVFYTLSIHRYFSIIKNSIYTEIGIMDLCEMSLIYPCKGVSSIV